MATAMVAMVIVMVAVAVVATYCNRDSSSGVKDVNSNGGNNIKGTTINKKKVATVATETTAAVNEDPRPNGGC
jgi:hypothetical protein